MATEWLTRFQELFSGSSLPKPRADSADSASRSTPEGGNPINPRDGRPISTIGTIGTQDQAAPSSDPQANAKVVPNWCDLFEERAAIYEYDGGYTRAEAEVLAWGELQNRWHFEHGARVARDLCAGCRLPIGSADVLDLIDGNRVHLRGDRDCLVQHGERWRAAATRTLLALGLRPRKAGNC
jgi:hypothetical protein